MDRNLRIVEMPDITNADGTVVDHWAIDRPKVLVLEGKMFMTPDGQFGQIPDKVVGLAGNQAAQGHDSLTMLDRFQLAAPVLPPLSGSA